MQRPALTFSYVVACAGAALAVWMMLPAEGTAGQENASMARAAAVAASAAPAETGSADRLVQRPMAESGFISARAPVPALRSGPNASESNVFGGPSDRKPWTAAADKAAEVGGVAAQPEFARPELSRPELSRPELAAKASIEADGYKNVRILRREADGKWIGRALRGSTEVAVGVDDSGTVSLQ